MSRKEKCKIGLFFFLTTTVSIASTTAWSDTLITRSSVSTDNTEGNASSGDLGGINISGDGAFVVFHSDASNLVDGDSNSARDIFVRNVQTGVTELVSIATGGAQGNRASVNPAISTDGRYVTFYTRSNLAANDTNGIVSDMYLHDRQTHETEIISISSEEVLANQDSDNDGASATSISADGRYVAFSSEANNLVADDNNTRKDVFVRDREAGTTERVSVSSDEVEGNNTSTISDISSDGRYVVFSSNADNLVANDSNGSSDVFVRDRQLGTTERVSVDSNGVEGTIASFSGSISNDGRYIAFESRANNLDLVVSDTNSVPDVFLHDRDTGLTTRISVNASGIEGNTASFNPMISSDGEFVVFPSSASNLVDGSDDNGVADIFLYERATALTTLISTDSNGAAANLTSNNPSIGDNGRYIAFESLASNLVSGDTNNVADVFRAATNVDPVITSSNAFSIVENSTAVFDITATDADGDAISFSLTGGADKDLFTINASAELSFLSIPDFETPTDANINNVYEAQITADDGNGGSASQDLQITVTDVDENPVFSSSAAVIIPEHSTTALSLAANDPDGDTVAFTITGGADQSSFLITGGNQLSFQAAPNFSPPGDANGNNVYEVTVTADDGNSNTATQDILITVTDVNDPPVINSPDTTFVETGTTGVFTLDATDPEGDTLAFTISGGADAALFSINANGELSFTTAPDVDNPTDSNGDSVYEVNVDISDGTLSTTKQLQITVAERLQVSTFSCADIVRTGQNFSCKVDYTVTDDNTLTTGLGLKIHFDSSKLEFVGFSNTLQKDLTAQTSTPVNDTQDFDQDSSTDKYVNTAWVVTSTVSGAGWPGEAVPVDLFDIEFKLKETVSVDDTSTLKMSAIPAEGQGYSFQADTHSLTAAPAFSWDIDGDGTTSFTSDGILIMRYLFDFRGEQLVANVTGDGATRDAAQIEAYLDQNLALLDVDADGKQRPLTDGLLIIRFLADFDTQETLLDGAISNTATRTDLNEILNYLEVFKD